MSGGSFRTFTIPQIAADNNGVYLVWDDFRKGTTANVFFTRSTDGGRTWSLPLVINDVTSGQHFFPTIAVSGAVISVARYYSRTPLQERFWGKTDFHIAGGGRAEDTR